jgi:hypothetical protein
MSTRKYNTRFIFFGLSSVLTEAFPSALQSWQQPGQFRYNAVRKKVIVTQMLDVSNSTAYSRLNYF